MSKNYPGRYERDEENASRVGDQARSDAEAANNVIPMCTYEDCEHWDKYCGVNGSKRRRCDGPEICEPKILKRIADAENTIAEIDKVLGAGADEGLWPSGLTRAEAIQRLIDEHKAFTESQKG